MNIFWLKQNFRKGGVTTVPVPTQFYGEGGTNPSRVWQWRLDGGAGGLLSVRVIYEKNSFISFRWM